MGDENGVQLTTDVTVLQREDKHANNVLLLSPRMCCSAIWVSSAVLVNLLQRSGLLTRSPYYPNLVGIIVRKELGGQCLPSQRKILEKWGLRFLSHRAREPSGPVLAHSKSIQAAILTVDADSQFIDSCKFSSAHL